MWSLQGRASYFEDELGSTVAMAHLGIRFFIERYAYHDYGAPAFFFDGLPVTTSAFENPYLFAGARWLPDTALYDLRTRHLDTTAGRFTSRDSIGIWGDAHNLGNGYTYVGNSSATHTDPFGEVKKPKFDSCDEDEEAQIYNSNGGAQSLPMASVSAMHLSLWTNKLVNKKWKDARTAWNTNDFSNDPTFSNGSIGKKYFGKYRFVRVGRIEHYAAKMKIRLKTHRIRIKCRSDGKYCGGDSYAWTFPSNYHAMIRVCRPQFFEPDGLSRVGKIWSTHDQVKTLIHEVAHNSGPIYDHRKDSDPSKVSAWGRQSPGLASYNADSYAWCAKNCFRVGCGAW
jgi:RHS repeat-associated protein